MSIDDYIYVYIREEEEEEEEGGNISEMKRSRDMEKSSEISSAIEELSMLVIVKPGGNHEAAHIPTKPFLSLCYLVLQVLGGFSYLFCLFQNMNVTWHLTHCHYACLMLLQIR